MMSSRDIAIAKLLSELSSPRDRAPRRWGSTKARGGESHYKECRLKHNGERKRRRTDENAMARRSNRVMCGPVFRFVFKRQEWQKGIDKEAAILAEEP